MPTVARLFAVTVDCPDPLSLANFYREFLGGELRSSNPDFVVLTTDGSVRLDFQRVDNHRPPEWPDSGAPRRLHLDFVVDDLEQVAQLLAGLGATRASHQPGSGRFLVMLDPAGHPLCLSTECN